jgi:RNA polymerase sigma factor (TIGR02999 family)
VTQLLVAWTDGNRAALEELIPVVYPELRRIAGRYLRRERVGHTLQPTALVHEAYVKLIDQDRARWQNRAQFFGVAAQLMRRILVDHARHALREKHGGRAIHVELTESQAGPGAAAVDALDALALDRALQKLEAFDPDQGRIVELRFFGGLTVEETAAALRISPTTVKREWALAKSWLHRELTGQAPSDGAS